MVKLFTRNLFCISLLFIVCSNVTGIQAQNKSGSYTLFEQMIYPKKQMDILSYLADDCAMGRGSGTTGNYIVSRYLDLKFKQYGLKPYEGSSFIRRFRIDSVTVGQNVAGIVPSLLPSDEYIIVSAHFDHLGTIKGAIYNGADDNASGVTALLNLAEIFASMRKAKMGPQKNLIFVALDGKEKNMAGSTYFVNHLRIPKEKIICDINIDQIGSTLEPIHKGKEDYVIVLGENTLKKKDRGKVDVCNRFYNLGLDIDFSFYGSKNFTQLFYRFSDQRVFNEAGIPALLFTSGFHKHTYKTTDDVNLINFPVLKKRTLLIFHLLMML